MRILNLLVTGGIGGIEVLCNNIDKSKKFDNYWCFLLDGGKIANEIYERAPNNVFILKHNKKKIFSQIKEITNICNDNKIDIVVLHPGGMYGNMIYSKLKKKIHNVKFVRFLHSCYERQYYLKDNYLKNKANLYFLNKALISSDLIVSVSKAVEKSFCDNFNIEKISKEIVYNGIGEEFFSKENSEGLKFNGNKTNIIYVGRLAKVKGVHILLDSISKIVKEKPNVKLTVVGDGKERRVLEEMALNLEIQRNVEFVGSQLDVISWLDKGDIFIYPVIWEEAFGISVVEAMSRGCIPIVSNKGGLPEIVDNEINGFIVNENNSIELSKKIIEVIDMKYKDKVAIRAIEKSKEFSISKTIDKLESIYSKLLKN